MFGKEILLRVTPVLLATATLTTAASGSTVGLNFGADEPIGVGSTVAPSVIAGAIPQGNWNNLVFANGSASGIISDTAGNAAPTTISVTWSSANTWASTGRGEENNGFPAGGDRDLMTGYLDTTESLAGSAVVTVIGLGPEFTTGGYDVLVYFLNAVSGRGGAYTIGGATKYGTSPANPTTHSEDPGVDLSDTGTYVRFRGLHDSSFTLTSNADASQNPPGTVNFRAPINGIQIVTVQALVGDMNGDGCVDRTDLNLLLDKIRAGSVDPAFDLNGDGKVDIADARFLVLHFTNPGGAPCP